MNKEDYSQQESAIQRMEVIRRFWDFYRSQRDDIANFDTFYVHFFSPDFWRPHQKRIRLLLEQGLSEPILEAGCGSGWATFALRQKGFMPVSIDLLDKQLAQSSLLFKFFNLEGQWIQTNMLSLPFPNEYFSSVIALDVLEHIKELDQTLLELWRILKSDGVMFVTVPNGWGSYAMLEDRLHKRFNLPFRRLLKRILLGDEKPNQKEGIELYHEHLRGKSWWQRQFKTRGFKVMWSINIEFISTVLFSRIGYEKYKNWARRDCRLAEKLPACLASEWFFQLKKI